MSSAICELPNEVLLAIVAHLDLAAVLELRQVRRGACARHLLRRSSDMQAHIRGDRDQARLATVS